MNFKKYLNESNVDNEKDIRIWQKALKKFKLKTFKDIKNKEEAMKVFKYLEQQFKKE